MADKIKEPTHYHRFAIQPVEFIMQNNLPYAEGNVVKYICRWRHKHKSREGQLDDLKKARQYIDFILQQESSQYDTETSTLNSAKRGDKTPDK
jgi:hypothetical protein